MIIYLQQSIAQDAVQPSLSTEQVVDLLRQAYIAPLEEDT